MPIPVIIISGFLGCGKTSFLRHLLPLCGEKELRPALIINEVGDIDVDGELLSDLHAEQVRLVGGCVCCTLQSQLTETIYKIVDEKIWDIIIIECSGLSNPTDVVNSLSTPALISELAISHIICLLDIRRAKKILDSIELAKAQVSSSDIIILNKIDLSDETTLSDTESLVHSLAPNSTIYHASYGDIGKGNLIKLLDLPGIVNIYHDHQEHDHIHSLPASFCTTAFELPYDMEYCDIFSFIQSLPEYAIRAKGFAYIKDKGWCILQKVFDSVSITQLTGPPPKCGSILICIGQQLVPEELLSMRDSFFEKQTAVESI